MLERIKKLKKDHELYTNIIKAKTMQQESLILQDENSLMPSDHWKKIERVALDLDKLRSAARTIIQKIVKLEKEFNLTQNTKIN